jgi:hypothetical protein
MRHSLFAAFHGFDLSSLCYFLITVAELGNPFLVSLFSFQFFPILVRMLCLGVALAWPLGIELRSIDILPTARWVAGTGPSMTQAHMSVTQCQWIVWQGNSS